LEEYWARKKGTPDMILNIKKHLVVFGINSELRIPLIKKLSDIGKQTVARCHSDKASSTLGHSWFDVESGSYVEDDSSVAVGGIASRHNRLQRHRLTQHHLLLPQHQLQRRRRLGDGPGDGGVYEALGSDMEEEVDMVLKEGMDLFL
jgi:hypothetical protein